VAACPRVLLHAWLNLSLSLFNKSNLLFVDLRKQVILAQTNTNYKNLQQNYRNCSTVILCYLFQSCETYSIMQQILPISFIANQVTQSKYIQK